MKLLFIWINQNDTGYIKQQGFNFDINHRFNMSQSEDKSKYILTYENHSTQYDIWKNNEIVGLTAIVGENGTGKTSLLECLYSSAIFPADKESTSSYGEFYRQQNFINKKLLVYQIKDEIRIFHNLLPEELKNETNFCEFNINKLSGEEMENIQPQTTIYVSNSNYTANFSGYSSYRSLNNISLTPSALQTIANSFFSKITKEPQIAVRKLNRFSTLQSILRKSKTPQDFQEICDICYYHYLHLNNLENRSMSPKRINAFEVEFRSVVDMLRKYKMESELSSKLTKYSDWVQEIPNSVRYDVMCVLCLNLIFEMYYVWNIDIYLEKVIKNFSDCMEVIQNMLDEYSFRQEKDDEQLQYYKNGQEEIKKIYSIIKNCENVKNVLPQSDAAYKKGRIIDFEEKSQRYHDFCECIDDFAQAKDSVVLKYIHVKNLQMSSGERALQNIFSWLRLPPNFDKYITTDSISICDDVLLLIDEIDLYMHPEWQRQCLKVFSEELKIQNPNKRIQIIVSMHSPLVLSDVPVQNTIYLKRGQDKLVLEDQSSKPQTFGANIHELLNDAFFLSNTMGAYAYEKIKMVTDDLIRLQNNPKDYDLKAKCQTYLPIVKMIGEPLIQHKLLSIYNELFPQQCNSAVERILQLPKELKNFPPNRESAVALKEVLQQAVYELDMLMEGE